MKDFMDNQTVKLLQGDCLELDETYFNIAKERIEYAQIKLGSGM